MTAPRSTALRALLVLTALAPAAVWSQDAESIEPVGSDAPPGAHLLRMAAPTELSEDDRSLTEAIRTTLAIELGNLGYEVIEPRPAGDDREPDLIVEYLVYALAPRVHVSVSVWLGDRSARVAATTERLRANVTLYNRMTALARATLQTAVRELVNIARVARVPLSLSVDAPPGTVAIVLPDRRLVLSPGDSEMVARGIRITVEFARDGHYSQTREYLVGAAGLELVPPELVIAPRWSVGLRYTPGAPLGFGVAARGYLLPGRLWLALEVDGYFTGGVWLGPGERANMLRHLEPRALAGVRLVGTDQQRWRVTLTSGFGAFFTWIDNDQSNAIKAFIDPYLVLPGTGFEYRFGAITVDVNAALLVVLDSPGQLLPGGIGASKLNPRVSVGAAWNW